MPQPAGWTPTIVINGFTLTWNEGGGLYFSPFAEGVVQYQINPTGGSGSYANTGLPQLEIDFPDDTYVLLSYSASGDLVFAEAYDTLGEIDPNGHGTAPAWASGIFHARGGHYPLLNTAPDWTESRGFSEANGFKAKYGFQERYGFRVKYGF